MTADLGAQNTALCNVEKLPLLCLRRNALLTTVTEAQLLGLIVLMCKGVLFLEKVLAIWW